MRVELVGFSQGVSLGNKDAVTNYLDFRREDGGLFRVPVTDDALNDLMVEIYGGELRPGVVSEDAPEVRIPEESDADIFGEESVPQLHGELDEAPESEEEISSL